jgi:hypothetical protein
MPVLSDYDHSFRWKIEVDAPEIAEVAHRESRQPHASATCQ